MEECAKGGNLGRQDICRIHRRRGEGAYRKERDDQLLVLIKVDTLMRVLAGERVLGDTLRIYYQEPDASDDL